MAINNNGKSIMLEGLKNYQHNGSDAFAIAVIISGGTQLTMSTSVTYGNPSGGVMSITESKVITISAGTTVTGFALLKGTGAIQNRIQIGAKYISAEVFTYQGTITILSATITLSDPE